MAVPRRCTRSIRGATVLSPWTHRVTADRTLFRSAPRRTIAHPTARPRDAIPSSGLFRTGVPKWLAAVSWAAMAEFELAAPFEPTGDQPQAIERLVAGIRRGDKHQVLLGATGTGKTATIAWTIQEV